VSLPTYPFARDRHWIADAPAQAAATPQPGATRLHPLVSHNSSTLREISFSAMLSGSAFYARDHRVGGQRIFPGAGFLEMACVAGELAGMRKVRRIRDVVFIRPLAFTDDAQLVRISFTPADEDAGFVVTSYDANRETVVHSEGVILFDDDESPRASAERLPLDSLKQQCAPPTPGARCYDLFAQAGLHYGPAFRTMQELFVGPSFALSRLVLAEDLKTDFDEFVLHPCLVDGALQTVAALAGSGQASVPYLPFAIGEIEILHPLSRACHVHVEEAEPARRDGGGDVRKFHLRITNDQGLVSVSIRDFCVRAFKPKPAAAAQAPGTRTIQSIEEQS
jgi:acyl transferase domain-containing protein